MMFKKLVKKSLGVLAAGLIAASMTTGVAFATTYSYNDAGKKAKEAAAQKEIHLDKGTEYHAYMLITAQESWVYRSRFFEKDQGVDSENFNQLVTSLNVDDPIPVGGKFEDAVIAGNGHYTLKLTGINGKLAEGSNAAALAILGFTTDIPYDQGIQFDNVNVKIDGVDKGTRKGSDVYYDKDDKTEPGLCTVELVNTWHDECQNPLNLALAQNSVEISFDVTGFNYDNPKATKQAETKKTEKKTQTKSEKTSLPIVPIVVVAVVVIAGVIVIVKKNGKNKN